MSSRKPSHADAELVLKLYDLRREPVMRESRKTMLRWVPKTFDDVRVLFDFEHPDNAAYRQVSSYFEYAFGIARHGIVPADFLAEYNGEGFLFFAKVEPFLAQIRAETSSSAFRNAEWVLKHSAWARERMGLFRKRLAALREAPAADAEPPATNGAPAELQKGGKGKARKGKGKAKGRKARAQAKQG
jgi:hypothetical protein